MGRLADKYNITADDFKKPSLTERYKLTKDDFTPKSSRTGFKGVMQDLLDSISEAPATLVEGLAALPGEVAGAGKQLITNPKRALSNALTGASELGAGILNTPGNIEDYLKSRDLISQDAPELRLPESILPRNFDYANALGIEGQQPGDALIRSGVSFAPFGVAGELGALGRGARALARAGSGAAFGVSQNENPLIAALVNAGAPEIARGIAKGAQKAGAGINALRPENLFRGQLTPEELAENLRITEGTETPLGDVIDNPVLKKQFENVLAKIPGSGAVDAMQRAGAQVTARGEQLLDKLGSPEGVNFGVELQDALKKAYEQATAEKNNRYEAVNTAAEEAGITTNRNNLISTAKSFQKKINSDPALKQFQQGELKSLIDALAGQGEIDFNKIPAPRTANITMGKESLRYNPLTGNTEVMPPAMTATSKPFKNVKGIYVDPATGAYKSNAGDSFSLKNTDFVRANLGDKAYQAYLNHDPEAKIYTALTKAAEKDINEAIDASDSPHVKKLRDEAMDYYRKEFAPFEDKDIVRFTRKGGDPDLLVQSFLRNSRTSDRSNLTTKLMEKLPQDKKSLVPLAYYSRALEDNALNPLKLKTLHKNLGKNQKDALFADKSLKKEFDDYIKLVDKNTEPLTQMFNPKTGVRNSDALAFKLGSALSGLGSLTGLGFGGAPGAIVGALVGNLAPGVVGRQVTKRLTSPAYREKLVNKMINQGEKKPKNPSSEKLKQSILKAAGIGAKTAAPLELYLNTAAGRESDYRS